MFKGFIGLCKGKLFNHAFDVMEPRKGDGFFAIECPARRPTLDRCAFVDQGRGVDFDVTHGF